MNSSRDVPVVAVFLSRALLAGAAVASSASACSAAAPTSFTTSAGSFSASRPQNAESVYELAVDMEQQRHGCH